METENYWLYLEPYVYATVKKNEALLYNSYDGKVLIYRSLHVLKIIEKLISEKNLYVIKLNGSTLNNIEVKNFVRELRESFMGDTIKATQKLRKPFQLMPTPKFFIREEEQEDVETYLMKNLFKLYFYINGKCSRNCTICPDAYKQFTFCTKESNLNELKIEVIKAIVEITGNSLVSEFNIIGGNVLEYNAIEKLIQILNESGKFINYYINYRNVNPSPGGTIFGMMREDKTTLKVLIDFPVDESIFFSVYNFLSGFDINKEYEFVITEKEQFDCINDMAANIDLENYTFRPFFNKKNINFFKKYVFLTKSDIIAEKPSLDDIFCRMIINKFFYGKLYVLPNGDVHSNINTQKIGDIHKHSLADLVLMEKMDGSNWKAIRSKIEPCRNCLYENICPPISNYEYVLGRYNLCNIKIEINQKNRRKE